MTISTVIPIYKNTELFLTFFRHNYSFLKQTEIILVDDASKEGLKEIIYKEFPKVIVLENETNLGFTPTVNKGVEKANGDIILLLNSDVKLLDDSYLKALKHFEDQQLFGVSFMQIEKDTSLVGKNSIYFKRGLFLHKKASDLTQGYNGWAEGGSSLLRKEYYKKLHGLDPLFAPFYWEDIDLSYRAYKSGYYALFDPSVKVEHHHGTTIKTTSQENNTKTIVYRNQFIFIWKNITDSNLWFQHIVFLPYHFVQFLVRGDMNFFKGFFKALLRIPMIISSRKNNTFVKTDDEVFNFIKTHE